MTTAVLNHTAAAVMAVLGSLHFVYTLYDAFVRPRYFRPANKGLLAELEATTIALAPTGHDFWRTLIGFHLSHSIGVLLFAFLIELAANPLMAWLRPGVLVVGTAYAVIGWTCWFWIPATGATLATVLLAVDWLLLA